MKKLNECKIGDIIRVDRTGQSYTRSILAIVGEEIIIDSFLDEPNIKISDDYYYIYDNAIYYPIENQTLVLPIYTIGAKHGKEYMQKQLQELIGCKN